MSKPLRIVRFPVTDYGVAWRWQQEAAQAVRNGASDSLALLQHNPVYTFGRRIRPEHLLVDRQELAARGAEVVETTRGGDITFHGPGQLVGYPILNLRRRGLGPLDYVCQLEEVIIRALSRLDIASFRVPGRPGVWTDAGKIAAIGVRVEGGVSLHGFALNVDPDLSYFDAIVPCGLTDATVTSIAQVGEEAPDLRVVERMLVEEFLSVFDYVPAQSGHAHQEVRAVT